MRLENTDGVTMNLDAEYDGVLEIFKEASEDILNRDYLSEGEKMFTIYRNANDQKIFELKNTRFNNIPLIRKDEFSGTVEIRWEGVAGRKKSYEYDSDCYDSIVLPPENSGDGCLKITFNNIENQDYIVFKFYSRDYKLPVGSKILFLFSNKEIHDFGIIAKPYKHSDHSDWGPIYETKVQLTVQELETFKDHNLSKWKIEFTESEKKIDGSIDSAESQFSIRKLANDYSELVQKKVVNYKPLYDRNGGPTKSPQTIEECFVYLMIDLTNNYHKIGISNKPEYREKTLQSEKPTIEMLCSKRFPNRKIAASFEQALHNAYGDKRVWGEWFDLTESEVKDLIEAISN